MSASVHPLPTGRRRKPTATSAFGVGRREAHDASGFYARFTAPVLSDDEELRRPREVDRIWAADASDMDPFVEDSSVALVVTSPPYFAGKAYEEALGEGHIPADYDAYLHMLFQVFEQCRNKLEPGGRIAVNVANLGRKPYRSLSADVTDILEQLGFLLRGEVIWQKSHAAGGSCAWGTFQRPGNPVLRDVSERIIVASKGRFDRALTPEQRQQGGWPCEGSITADEFIDATTDIWDFPSESATRVGHPAPFPVELPRRLIELHTYRGDVVLDPFMGSGTTAVAALRTGRHYLGFDTDPAYVRLAEQRVATERGLEEAGAEQEWSVALPARLSRRDAARRAGEHPHAWARRTGASTKELARALLTDAGFSDVEDGVKIPGCGVQVAFRARDGHGRPWLFELCGGFSITRPGLRNGDVLWKALGAAAVLHAWHATATAAEAWVTPLVLLTTDVPAPRSAGGRALAAMTGTGRPVHRVVELVAPDALARLTAAD